MLKDTIELRRSYHELVVTPTGLHESIGGAFYLSDEAESIKQKSLEYV